MARNVFGGRVCSLSTTMMMKTEEMVNRFKCVEHKKMMMRERATDKSCRIYDKLREGKGNGDGAQYYE